VAARTPEGSNLICVNLLGRKKRDDGENDEAKGGAAAAGSVGQAPDISGTTAPKGRPTPKRSEGAKKRGPVAPAPQTSAEARRRRKELRGPKLTGEERKAERLTRRAEMAERREKMMAGDDAYLLPRDKGPVRRYVRDVVDSRRSLLGLFMPAALGLIFIMLSVPSPAVQLPLSYAMPVLVVIMLIDALFLGRKVNKLVDEKFPNNTESGWKLGFYAASRASQLRRMRAPRPQVERGAKVA